MDGGKGKACRNSRRIAILPADVLQKDVPAIGKTKVVIAKIPATSIKNFSSYVTQCAKVLEVPPFAVVTQMSTAPHPTSLFTVNWKIQDEIKNQDALEALYAKRADIAAIMVQPYPKLEPVAAVAKSSGKY